MSHERDEELLREEFRRLRETTESGRLPDFAAMMAEARADAPAPSLEVFDGGSRSTWVRPTHRRALVLGGWASAAIAAAVAGILLIGRGPDADQEFERLVASYSAEVQAGTLRSPTAPLLEVPGMSLTRSMPSIGTSLRDLDPSTRPLPPDGRDS